MAELIKLGKELGYEGHELRDWVSRQQDIQRADKTAEQEAEKAKAEAEKARAEADAEKVRVEAEAEKARAEADAEKARAEAEIERFKLEVRKELELEKMRQDLEKEKIDLARQVELQKVEIEDSKSKDRTAHARDPKLPYFYDSKDKMDSYLQRVKGKKGSSDGIEALNQSKVDIFAFRCEWQRRGLLFLKIPVTNSTWYSG